jgi:hypothetical protein
MSKFPRNPFNCGLVLSLVVSSSLAQDSIKTLKDSTISIATVLQMAAAPEAFGSLVYRGDVFYRQIQTAPALFRYERRVAGDDLRLVSAHITRSMEGEVVIVEAAHSHSQYDLHSFSMVNQQLKMAGQAVLSKDGRQIDYWLDDNGVISTSTESVSSPVVTGPTLFGFILRRWENIVSGNKLPVRMIVMKAKTSYGFEIEAEAEANGQRGFSIRASNLLVRMAVPTFRVVFEASSRRLIRYEGLVPPMAQIDGKFKDLNARVDYQLAVEGYR